MKPTLFPGNACPFILFFLFLSNLHVSGQCTLPAKPASITVSGGNAKVCPGDSRTYSVPVVATATSYIWMAPSGGNIVSGQGTTTVTVDYTTGFISGDSLKVQAVNSCGAGPGRSIYIARNEPPLTGAFTGPATGFCNMTGVAYSVPQVAGVTFAWSLNDSGATITGGQGTNAVTVDFTTAFNHGILGVSTVNACGISGEHHLHLYAYPVAPNYIYGSKKVCRNAQQVHYYINPVPTATDYTWTGPSGSHISDGITTSASSSLTTTSTSVTVNYGPDGGVLKVRGNNACGTGTFKAVNVSIGCRELRMSGNNLSVLCYPVPAKNVLNISFLSDDRKQCTIKISDMIGNIIEENNFYSDYGNNNFSFDVSGFVKGIYILETINGDDISVQKITVQ